MSSENYSVELPRSIDYTSRDFTSIRNDLIQRIKDTNRLPEWVGADPADFGVVMVESFAYLGDLLSYYIDRVANESFITTAVKPASVYSLARSYGYQPTGYRQALVEVTLTNDNTEDVTLPAGTVFGGENVFNDRVIQVYFTSNDTVIVPASGSTTASATHGKSITQYPIVTQNTSINQTYGEVLDSMVVAGANLTYELSEDPVVDGSVEIYVKDGDNYTKWTRVSNLLDYGPTDLVYTTFFTDDNTYYVQFGDGVSGAIPAGDSLIQALYTVGGGVSGNIATETLNEIVYVPNVESPEVLGISVTNLTQGAGGFEPESLESIRILAPLTYRSGNRAVTLQDFESLALSVSNAGKAKAIATTPTSVTLYVSPSRNNGDVDPSPGIYNSGTELSPVWQATSELVTLKSDVSDYITPKMMIGTSLTMANPTYMDVMLSITYKVLDQFVGEDVETNIKKTILLNYGYPYVDFGQTIYPQDIEYLIQRVSGVRYAKVTQMYFDGDTPGLAEVVAGNGEIPRFTSANMTLILD